jgi:hypothetical protein
MKILKDEHFLCRFRMRVTDRIKAEREKGIK